MGNEYCVLAVDGVEVVALEEADGVRLWESVEEGNEAGLVVNLKSINF